MVRARVRGVADLERKLKRMTPAAKRHIVKANQASAGDFKALLKRTIPRGDDERGHLADTVKETPGRTETAVRVSVGDAEHPYPLHLEAGRKAPDGSHVPGKPFWWPAKRVLKKKVASRGARALRNTVKEISS